MATKPRDANIRHTSAEAFGYPLHRVIDRTPWTNQHQVQFNDVIAKCGHEETIPGTWQRKSVLQARTGELCENGCWD